MFVLRRLTESDMYQAVGLKVACWPEELAGLSAEVLDLECEHSFWTEWMNTAPEHNDVRLLYGAFGNGEMLGVAFGSFVESKDSPESGFELNGLWVEPSHRGKGVALSLIDRLLCDFHELGAEKIVIYSFHHSPSNHFYRRLGCEVTATEHQLPETVPVDVFSCDIVKMKAEIHAILENRHKPVRSHEHPTHSGH